MNPLPTIDMHCHVMQSAKPIDGSPAILGVTFNPDEYEACPTESSASRTVWAVGLHPWEYRSDEQLEAFERHVASSLAVGEIGLDGTARAGSPMDVQRTGLRRILANPETKRRLGSIHGLMAYQDVVDVLRSEPTPGMVFHWFMGMGETFEQAVALDIFFSVNDAMLALPEGRDVVAQLPRLRVLTETDAPWIQAGTGLVMEPGEYMPGGPALRPGELSYTETFLAQAWGETLDAVRLQLWQNLAELESRVDIRPFGAAELLAGV